MTTSISKKIQNSLNFWWILVITLFFFSLSFLAISVYIYNNYCKENINIVKDDNNILNDIIVPSS